MPRSRARTRAKRISQNIKTEKRAGRSTKQAIAIAYSMERQRNKKSGKRRKRGKK